VEEARGEWPAGARRGAETWDELTDCCDGHADECSGCYGTGGDVHGENGMRERLVLCVRRVREVAGHGGAVRADGV
jgi:hypothetical protein